MFLCLVGLLLDAADLCSALVSTVLLCAIADVMDGMECTRVIRPQQLPQRVRPYIIAYTANVTQEFRQACMDAGMDAFTTKVTRTHAHASTAAAVHVAVWHCAWDVCRLTATVSPLCCPPCAPARIRGAADWLPQGCACVHARATRHRRRCATFARTNSHWLTQSKRHPQARIRVPAARALCPGRVFSLSPTLFSLSSPLVIQSLSSLPFSLALSSTATSLTPSRMHAFVR